MGVDKDSKEGLTFKINPDFLKKAKSDVVLLILFLIILLKFMSVFDGGYLIHQNGPYNFAAGDMFTFVAFADIARYQEDMTKQPPYMAAGQTDAVNFFSMFGAIINAQLSSFLNAETHNFVIHLNLLFMVFSILIIFYFVSKININAALLGLPLSLLVFKWPFQYAITWGMHGSTINMLYIATSLFCLYYLNKKYVFILLGILNGAGVLAHAREFLMFNIGIALYFLIRLIKENIAADLIRNPCNIKRYLMENKTVVSLRNYVFSIPITMLMMFRILPVLKPFLSGSNAMGSSSLVMYSPPTSFHHVFFNQFGFYQYLIILGTILGIYLLFAGKDRKTDVILSFCFIFLLSGFFSILNNKTSQIRHLFPILLMPLIGLLIYFVYSQLKKTTKVNSGFILTVLFLALLIPTAVYHSPATVKDYSFSDPYTWEGMSWITQNVKDSENILILYGDRHTQPNMFALTRKPHYFALRDPYLEKVSKGFLTSSVLIEGDFPHFYARQTKFNELKIVTPHVEQKIKSICDYEYIYSDKVSSDKKIQAYTQQILMKLIDENKFTAVFQNELAVILKNPDVGQKCFNDEAMKT